MTKKSKPLPKFSKVSEWIAAGNMSTGLYSLERVERETDKAVGFKAEKHSDAGNLKPAIAWFPRSMLQVVENDFYIHGPARMFLVPAWLYDARTSEGYEI